MVAAGKSPFGRGGARTSSTIINSDTKHLDGHDFRFSVSRWKLVQGSRFRCGHLVRTHFGDASDASPMGQG